MRSVAREVVFKFIFSKLFNSETEGLFNALLKNSEITESDKDFAYDLLDFIEKDYSKYEEIFNDLTLKFHSSRIFPADKCACILGMAEFDNYSETPKPVIINEAVNLAGKYSTEKSTDFVNGILAEYTRGK